MTDTRAVKLWRDVRLHASRSVLVVLAMTVALAAAGAMLVTWLLVRDTSATEFARSLPASATLSLDRVDETLLARVRAMPDIAAVRARRDVRARVLVGGTWRPALLFAIDAPDGNGLGKLSADGGAWPPTDDTIVVERSSVTFAAATLGDSLRIAIGDGDPLALPVRGFVRDVSLAPGWMEHTMYAFVTPATLTRLGADGGFDRLQIRGRGDTADRATNRAVATRVAALARSLGYRVDGVDVPTPNRHLHQDQMDSMLMTQAAFALLALVSSALLVVNLIGALLAGQAREIGILKAIGARTRQIVAMYLAFAALLGACAAVLALPLAVIIGERYAALRVEMLNFRIDDHTPTVVGATLLVAIGILLPLLAAAAPVLRAARVPVAVALRDLSLSTPGERLFVFRFPIPAALRGAPLLALRNAFRRCRRTLVTILALAVGGAVFLGAAALREGVIGSVDLMFARQRHDITLSWPSRISADALLQIASAVPGASGVDVWYTATAQQTTHDGGAHDAFPLFGVDAAHALAPNDLDAGRWLATNDDARELVVSRRLLRENPELAVGDALRLRIAETDSEWRIVGVIDGGPQLLAYAPRAALAVAAPTGGTALVVRANARDDAGQLALIARLRAAFGDANLAPARSQRTGENRRVIEDHLLMVVQFLAVMGWVMVAVGGMGLASTMGIAVLERTREIGVLRAIGAPHRTIVAMVQAEGAVLALLAAMLAIPLAIPMGRVLGDAFGRIMFTLPPVDVPPVEAIAQWFALSIIVSVLACIGPARRAMRLPVARALAYG